MPDENDIKEARMDGKYAFKEGKKITDNPHTPGNAWHHWWHYGYKMEEQYASVHKSSET